MNLPSHNQRTSIRLATIAALTNVGVPPYPTMAHNRVYDSKQDPIAQSLEQQDIPCISVYTDSDIREPIDPHTRGLAPMKGKLNLILELSLSNFGGATATDAEMEWKLDAFETQIFNCLSDPRSEVAQAWAKTFIRVEEVQSRRLANATHDHRLAQRDLIFLIEYQDGCVDWKKAFPNFESMVANVAVDTNILTQVQTEIPQ